MVSGHIHEAPVDPCKLSVSKDQKYAPPAGGGRAPPKAEAAAGGGKGGLALGAPEKAQPFQDPLFDLSRAVFRTAFAPGAGALQRPLGPGW